MVTSAPQRSRHVASENAFSCAEPARQQSAPRPQGGRLASVPRVFVLGEDHCLPHSPIFSPEKNSPKTSGLRRFRRDRLLRTSSLAKVSILAEKPKPCLALSRSKSASEIPSASTPLGLRSSPSLLPAHFIPRCRSTPTLRPAATSGLSTSSNYSALGASLRPSALGASLRLSGRDMLLSSAAPTLYSCSELLPVPAAKAFFDPTTGKSVHLRLGR